MFNYYEIEIKGKYVKNLFTSIIKEKILKGVNSKILMPIKLWFTLYKLSYLYYIM